MSTISFILRPANKQAENPITVKHTHGTLAPFTKATGISVPSKYFDKVSGKVSNKLTNHVELNAAIEQVRSDVEKAARNILGWEEQPDNAAMAREYDAILKGRAETAANYVKVKVKYGSILEQLKGELADLEQQVIEKKARIIEYEISLGQFEGKLITKFIQDYIDTKGKRLATNRVYKSLKANIKEFRQNLTIDQITPDLLGEFENYLLKKVLITKKHPDGKRLSNGSVKLYVIRLKTICREYADRVGFDLTAINKHRLDSETLKNQNIIYLTPTELQDLADVQLPNPSQDRVRDSFLLMASTGLRFSDSFITPEQIKGGYIVLNTKKTSTLVKIPLNETSKAILEKYDNCMPTYSFQWFQKTIKKVGKLAGLTELELVTVKNGSDTKSDYLEKWEVLSAHVARKTFITYALSENVNPAVLKKWIGHSRMEMMLNHYASGTINSQKEMDKVTFTK
jgi:Phage integrase SAM-like domain